MDQILSLSKEKQSPEVSGILAPRASLWRGLELICDSHRMVLAGNAIFPSRQCFIVCHTANTSAALILPDCELFSFLLLGDLTKENYKQTNKTLLFVPVSSECSVKFSCEEKCLNWSWRGKLSWINTFWWVEISEVFSGRKCIDIDPSEHLKTISKALSTGDIWPIMKVIYLASSLPERKHTNGLLFDKWFQWKHFPFLDKVFIHKESKKSMVEVFAKLKKVFGDSLKCPFLGSDSLHKATWGCSHSKTIFTENRRKF